MSIIDKRSMFVLLITMQARYFRSIVLYHLRLSGDIDVRRFTSSWTAFLKILLSHVWWASPIHYKDVKALVGHKCSVQVYMMVGCGWLKVSSDHHTVITEKGLAVVRACMKKVEEDYSRFWVAQEAAKEEVIAKRAVKLSLRKTKPRCKPFYSIMRYDTSK